MCLILMREDFIRKWTDDEERLVYKIFEKRGDKLYSPERNVVWTEEIGKIKTVNSLPITEKDGFIYTSEGLYSYKQISSIILLLAKGKTKEEWGKYRVFRAKIPKYTQYIEGKYQIVSKSLKLVEDITDLVMNEVKWTRGLLR